MNIDYYDDLPDLSVFEDFVEKYSSLPTNEDVWLVAKEYDEFPDFSNIYAELLASKFEYAISEYVKSHEYVDDVIGQFITDAKSADVRDDDVLLNDLYQLINNIDENDLFFNIKENLKELLFQSDFQLIDSGDFSYYINNLGTRFYLFDEEPSDEYEIKNSLVQNLMYDEQITKKMHEIVIDIAVDYDIPHIKKDIAIEQKKQKKFKI